MAFIALYRSLHHSCFTLKHELIMLIHGILEYISEYGVKLETISNSPYNFKFDINKMSL